MHLYNVLIFIGIVKKIFLDFLATIIHELIIQYGKADEEIFSMKSSTGNK
jgi:hypothetical protein